MQCGSASLPPPIWPCRCGLVPSTYGCANAVSFSWGWILRHYPFYRFWPNCFHLPFTLFDPNGPDIVEELRLSKLHFQTSQSRGELARVYGYLLNYSWHHFLTRIHGASQSHDFWPQPSGLSAHRAISYKPL
jgi:hypothetical protein